MDDKPYIHHKNEKFKISEKGMSNKELYENFSPFLSDCINWKSEKTQFNITPPTTIQSVAGCSVANLLNPNAIWDVACGSFGKLEVDLIHYLGGLVKWKNNSGVFVFGGTATNMYGIKLGINSCQKDVLKEGINKDIYIISNEEGHSCHVTICNWLGLGENKCLRIKTNEKGKVEHSDVLEKAEELFKENKKLACIILNGGTNFNGEIDPIKNVVEGIDSLVKKYDLDYKPHIHVDSVIGWVFLFFKTYNFETNPLKIPKDIIKKIKEIYNLQKDIELADSFGVDFHKTGFCPYLSSAFILKDSTKWKSLIGNENLFTHQAFNFGDYKPGEYTLETSRPVSGAVSAYLTLNTLGITGMQEIIANFLYVSLDLKEKILKSNNFLNCNYDSKGWSTLFLAKKLDNHPNFDELYNTSNEKIILENNNFQKGFFEFLSKKYENKIPWNIGFAKCYRKNKFGFSISTLKNYPMSPFINVDDNTKYLNWITENLKEYKNENTR
jgi:glutamate/tyrosine decarboxylase-like PLP-dependent enzyme